MKYTASTFAIICSLLLTTGCASKGPSFGNSVKAEGKAVSDIGEKWEKGRDMVKKGNKLVRKGNKQIDDGQENVADGKAMAVTGEKLIAEAEAAYKQLTPAE